MNAAADCVRESDHDHDGAQDHTVAEGAIGQTADGIEELQQTATNRGHVVALARERGELKNKSIVRINVQKFLVVFEQCSAYT